MRALQKRRRLAPSAAAMSSSPPTDTDLARFSERSGGPASLRNEGGGSWRPDPDRPEAGPELAAAAEVGPEAELGAGGWEAAAEAAERAEEGPAEEPPAR